MSGSPVPAGKMKRYYSFIIVLLAVGVMAVAADTLVRRGPVHDRTASNDIRSLQSAVDTYYLTKNRLPATMSQLELSGDVERRRADYEYHTTNSRTYELCATFLTARPGDSGAYNAREYAGSDDMIIANPEVHQKGRQCFTYRQAAPLSPRGR